MSDYNGLAGYLQGLGMALLFGWTLGAWYPEWVLYPVTVVSVVLVVVGFYYDLVGGRDA